MSRLINTELTSDSDSSDSDLDDNDLMTKLWFWFRISHFANFKQVKKNSYFADFEQKQIKHKTPFGETRYLSIYFFFYFIFSFLFLLFFFFECLGIQVFSSLMCDLRDTMPHQGSLTLSPREVEDFPRGGNHSKHMPPLTHLAWLPPIYYSSRSVFIHINITKMFTCGENFNKKYSFFPGPVLKIAFFSKFSLKKKIFFQV